MDDHLHPAIDIPGGLWRGAIVEVRSIVMTLTVVSMAGGGAYIEGHRGPWDLTDLSLDLHAPDGMGLGLAGLAARVAERIGAEPREALHTLVTDLAHQPWALPHWCDAWLNDRLAEYDRVIREAATLLARLDRLAAAVDPTYTVRPGVVPTWERRQDAWVLTLGDRSWSVGCEGGPLPDDPIEAAGAALEVRGG